MISTFRSALALALTCAPALAAQQVSYDISFPSIAHHEARVTMTVTGARGPVAFRMSASSPGRYALTGFGKNVYDVSAVDGRQRPLTVTHTDPEGWSVAGHDGTIALSYTVFGDRGDGTYMQVDNSHAHLNMPATFMWARGFETRPIRIAFHPPEGSGWKIATQLMPTNDSTSFTAPNLDYFMDCPTELSAFTLRTWTSMSNGRAIPYRLALHHLGTETEADSFAAMAKRIVDQEIAVFGEAPDYDTGNYTFIADYLPWATGDGMEHRNSTFISSTASLQQAAVGLLGTVSHEFFHSWNMERIRARGIEPFDFSRANMTDGLWEGEGFTQYYGPLMLRRAGITSVQDFARTQGFTINGVINSPGRNHFSPAGMSEQAPWRDGAAVLDVSNAPNIFISYYTWGAAVALGLDLTLRENYPGKSLDGYMRTLWTDYGKPFHPYTLDDLERSLGRYSGDAAFAHDFFTRYVRGRETVDYAALLAKAGFQLRRAAPNAGFIGNVRFEVGPNGAILTTQTLEGTPVHDAGLDRGDRILSIDGRPLTADSVWTNVRNAHHAGDVVVIEYESRGRRMTARMNVIEDPRLEVVSNEEANLAVTPEMQALRQGWLEAGR